MYTLIVGNIGKINEYASRQLAQQEYESYVNLSTQECGRAAGESIFLFENDEIISEYIGSNDVDDSNEESE